MDTDIHKMDDDKTDNEPPERNFLLGLQQAKGEKC